MSYLINPYAFGIPPATISYAANSNYTSGGTSHTHSGVSIGTAAANRKVAVGIVGSGTSSGTVSAVTIAGVSASQVVAINDVPNENTAEIWQAAVPTGTSGDIVITWSSAKGSSNIGVWRITGAASAANDTGSSSADPATDTLDIPANGVALGCIISNGAVAWTNLTENYDTNFSGGRYSSGASAAFATQQTGLSITADPASGPVSMTIASWGPG